MRLDSNWIDLTEPIDLSADLTGAGNTVLNYTGPPVPSVVRIHNKTKLTVSGIKEIRCGQAECGLSITADDNQPVSAVDNQVLGVFIHGGTHGVVIGDGRAKSTSENKFRDCHFTGSKSGVRINGGNAQNQYFDTCRFSHSEVGVDLVRGGYQDRGCIYTYHLRADILIGDPNDVVLLDGSYSEGECPFIDSTAQQTGNPGVLSLRDCHVHTGIRWTRPGPVIITGGRIGGTVESGGTRITPVTCLGVQFDTAVPFRRLNDTGTLIALGCTAAGVPFTSLDFAGPAGLVVQSLSDGPKSARGFRVATLRGPKWSSGIEWDGGGRVGGGEDATAWAPKSKEK